MREGFTGLGPKSGTSAPTSDLGEQIYVGLVRDIAGVAALSEQDRRDLHIAVNAGIRLLDDSGAPLSDTDVSRLHDGVRVLAAAGLPLADFLRCQESCGSRAVAAQWRTADLTRPAAVAERLRRSGRRWRDLATELLCLFLDESAARSGVPAATQVARAVLDGSLTPALAAVCGLPQPVDGYLVAALPAAPEVTRPLAETGRCDLAWRYEGGELILLTPVSGGAPGVEAARSRIGDALRAVLPLVDVPAVGVLGPHHRVTEAVQRSRHLRSYAVAADLAELLNTPEDLAVDRAVAGIPEVAAGLRALVAPLGAGTELRRTLRILYRVDLHRARAAEVLGIHRQTLTYRLNRIRELTGVDPVSVRGVAVLVAALAADPEVPLS